MSRTATPQTLIADDLDAHRAFLARCGSNFDESHMLVGERAKSLGYHSSHADGTWVHQTRESLDYALALLDGGSANEIARAEHIIRAVVELQDVEPTSPTFGVWPWTLEEPLAEMDPPDLNWADFCGARLVHALACFGDAMTDETCRLTTTAARHAAWAIFRRNTGPDYTNIAILGALVTLAVGELVDDPLLVRFGRDRLRAVRDLAGPEGRFAEFNSPTYTVVALVELDRLCAVVHDDQALALARELHRVLWQMIAEHFHPPTQQWAGPHSRAYSDLLEPWIASYLSGAVGIPLRAVMPRDRNAGSESDAKGPWFVPPERYSTAPVVACPNGLRERFLSAQSDGERCFRRVYQAHPDGEQTVGTTWFGEDACLGSVNHSFGWVQRRSLLGYWPTRTRDASEGVAVLRLRALKDGADFSAVRFRMNQQGRRVLATAGPAIGTGDHHPILGQPEGGRFAFRELAVRLELTAADAMVEDLGCDRFALQAGCWKAVLHGVPGVWDGRPIHYGASVVADGTVAIDLILYKGEPQCSSMASVLAEVGWTIEVLHADEAVSPAPRWERDSDGLKLTWGVGSTLAVPALTAAEPLRW